MSTFFSLRCFLVYWFYPDTCLQLELRGDRETFCLKIKVQVARIPRDHMGFAAEELKEG